jgi:L-threonylcarbamoyladenylate synthase
MTITFRVDPEHPDAAAIEKAASVIRDGGLVAFPTETVYGLGADAMNEEAVRKIFDVKGRPQDNPIIVHVSDMAMLGRTAREVSPAAGRLAAQFWPGPLTLVFPSRSNVAPSVRAGLTTVAVRMPANRIALELIKRANTPIAAPSANISGRPSPTRGDHVLRDLSGKVDVILDGGQTSIGVESTVLDLTTDPPAILRPGWITREALANVIGDIESEPSPEKLRRSPGTRYRHYTPSSRVLLVETGSAEFITQLCSAALANGPVAFVGHTPIRIEDPGFLKYPLQDTPASYARSMYATLREIDELKPALIVIQGIQDTGEGAAVMDRLRRAASETRSE